MVLAARWGRLFQTDPFSLLDRGVDELEIAVAVYQAAVNDIKSERG